MLNGHIFTRGSLMLVDFLSRYRAKSTRSFYVSAWVKFLSLAYGARLGGTSAALLEPWAARYANDLRNGRRDLAADLQALSGACRSGRTATAYQGAIRSTLADAGIALHPAGAGRLRRSLGRHRPPAAREPLTPGKVLRILEHLDTRGRAILYILLSSGVGLGDALSIRMGDLDLDSRPARFLIGGAGRGPQRTAFISREAAGAIRVYLIVRERFLASARSRGGTAPADLLFPLGARTFEQVWNRALSKAGLEKIDGATGRRTLTPRATRRFFAERMGTVLPLPVIRELMGDPGLRRRPSGPEAGTRLEEAYLDGEDAITLQRAHRKETLARKVAELERLVGVLREQVEGGPGMPGGAAQGSLRGRGEGKRQ